MDKINAEKKQEKKKNLAKADSKAGQKDISSVTSIIPESLLFFKRFFANSEGFVEIREILNGNAKSKFFKNFDDFKEYEPPNDKNVYIGMYTRKHKRGRKEDIKKTRLLWLDFDNMELAEAEYRVNMAGMPSPSMVVASGHGYHFYWKLKNPVKKELESVIKELANKTKADTRAAELSKVMRLPGTMNVKDDPVECRIVKQNQKTYSLDSIAETLNVEPTAPLNDRLSDYIGDYKQLLSEADRPCVKAMLEGVEEGQRNFVLGRLTMYFRNIKGYSKRKTRQIILGWNTLNNPSENKDKLLSDFNSYWHSDYNLLGCYIKDHKDLQQILTSYCDKDTCGISDSFTVPVKNKVATYNNRLIKNIKDVSGKALVVYGVLEKNPQGLTAERAAEIMEITPKTFRKRVKELLKKGYVGFKKGIKRRGISDLYYIKRQGTYNTGRTSISYGAVRLAAVGDITPAQFKLYLLLHYYYWFSKTNEVYPSTFTLGEKLGVSRSRVSHYIRELERKDYIQIDRESKKSNLYTLKI